jgi:hypothetical protein
MRIAIEIWWAFKTQPQKGFLSCVLDSTIYILRQNLPLLEFLNSLEEYVVVILSIAFA